jgi:hypothetical protein
MINDQWRCKYPLRDYCCHQPPSAHTSYGHSRFHSSDIGLGGMDVVPGGVNQMVVSLASQSPRSRRFCACGVGLEQPPTGIRGFGDSGPLGFWNVSMLLFSLGCWQCARRLAEPSWPPNAGVTERLARASTGRTWCCKQADLAERQRES